MDAHLAPFDRILVPARPPAEDDRGLAIAGALARRAGVPVELLSVARPIDMERAARMLAAPDQHDVPPLVVVNRVVGTGSVAASIVAAAEPGTLVCMTSHGAYGPARTLAGSVTEGVIRTTRTPVLLIGPQVHARDPLVAGAIVGCIGHLPERDRETVATARRWAGAFRLPLRLTHVVPRPDPALERRIEDRVRALAGADAATVLHDRRPAHGLASLAMTAPVALFVMAPTGRSGWDRVLAGSVTASTVRRSTAPVLAIPAQVGATTPAFAR